VTRETAELTLSRLRNGLIQVGAHPADVRWHIDEHTMTLVGTDTDRGTHYRLRLGPGEKEPALWVNDERHSLGPVEKPALLVKRVYDESPRLLRLIRRVIAPVHGDDLIQGLNELYSKRRFSTPSEATRWYRNQIRGIAWKLALERIRSVITNAFRPVRSR